jgi:uncharacterized membrane protein (UPF0182 family)
MNLEAIGQSVGMFAFLPFFFIIFLIAVFFAIGIFLCVWVYRDAKSRGMDGTIWLIIVLIGNILGLIVYLIVRADRTREAMPKEGIKYCVHCGQQISQDAKYCKNCGKQVA